MKPALLHRPGRPWTFWIAFACAAGIHVGAIVLAKNTSEKLVTQNFRPPGVEVDVFDNNPEDAASEQTITPPAEQFSPKQDTFLEERRPPTPVRPRRKTLAASFTTGTPARLGSVKALVMYAPRPAYPYEARRQRLTGSGIALLTVDPVVGSVTSVWMTQSCGNTMLDKATLDAFRRWRFKSRTVVNVEVPITYTLTGVSY
jgi:TonB family protein